MGETLHNGSGVINDFFQGCKHGARDTHNQEDVDEEKQEELGQNAAFRGRMRREELKNDQDSEEVRKQRHED